MKIARITATVAATVVAVLGFNTPAASALGVYYDGLRFNLHHVAKVVYVEDHTANTWNVKAAVAAWDKGTDVSVRYGKCRTGAGCIHIFKNRYGKTGWVGRAHFNYNPATHAFVGVVVVTLNESYALTPGVRQQIACHEIGHGLGLQYHSTALNTCMHVRANTKASRYPSAQDKAVLNVFY